MDRFDEGLPATAFWIFVGDTEVSGKKVGAALHPFDAYLSTVFVHQVAGGMADDNSTQVNALFIQNLKLTRLCANSSAVRRDVNARGLLRSGPGPKRFLFCFCHLRLTGTELDDTCTDLRPMDPFGDFPRAEFSKLFHS